MTTPACYSPCQWGPFGHRDLWEQHAGRRATVLDGTARPKAGAWARQDPTGLQGPDQDLGTVLSPAALLPLQSSYQEHKQSRQRAHLTLFSKCPSTSAFGDGEIPVTFVYFPENTGKHSEVLFSKVQVGMRNTVLRQEGLSIIPRQHLSLQLSFPCITAAVLISLCSPQGYPTSAGQCVPLRSGESAGTPHTWEWDTPALGMTMCEPCVSPEHQEWPRNEQNSSLIIGKKKLLSSFTSWETEIKLVQW